MTISNNAEYSDFSPPTMGTNNYVLYARTPPDSRAPRGWLVDLLNKYLTYI